MLLVRIPLFSSPAGRSGSEVARMVLIIIRHELELVIRSRAIFCFKVLLSSVTLFNLISDIFNCINSLFSSTFSSISYILSLSISVECCRRMRSPKDSHNHFPDFALYMPGPHGVCSFGYQFDNYTNTKMSDNSQTESRLSSETLNLTCRRPSLDKIMLSYAITPHLRAYYGDYYSVMHLPFDGRSMYDSRFSPPYNAFIWCKKLISCIQPTSKCLVSSYTVLEHLLSIDYKSITYNCKSLATLDLQIISLHVRLLLLELHQRNLRNRFNEYYRQDSMRLATAINVELPACEFLMTQLDKFLQDKIVEIWCVEAVLGERSDIHYMC